MLDIVAFGPELVWLVLLIVFVLVETATTSIVSIWFALGSLIAMVFAVCNAPIWLQATVFAVVSVLTLVLTRPLVSKFVSPKLERTNFDRILDLDATVTEEIDNLAGTGCVFVDGKDWTARSEDNTRIEKGEIVKIKRIEGVKVFVSKK